MLADSMVSPSVGAFNATVYNAGTALSELLNFIADELPNWRDRHQSLETKQSSETTLTSRLCAHLNSACRFKSGFDIYQFRVEEADEAKRGRHIDLIASPCNARIELNGRTYIDFDTILPIECKRLPTPSGKDRDEREYVISKKTTTGGIHRFKEGHHASKHNIAVMIAYFEKYTPEYWHTKISTWITGLANDAEYPDWTLDDLLTFKSSEENKVTKCSSIHKRKNDLGYIELKHLWIKLD